MEKLYTTEENAAKFWLWLTERGGIAVWNSLDLSSPDKSWSSPAHDVTGKVYNRPSWRTSETPNRIVTDPEDVVVCFDRVVTQFRVTVEHYGLSIRCSASSSRRIRQECEKAGEGAYYKFDYELQECLIYAPDRMMKLTTWADLNLPKIVG